MGNSQAMEKIQQSINPVNPIPGVIVGSILFIIVLGVGLKITSDASKTKKINKMTYYLWTIIAAIIIGIIAGSMLYNLQFTIANPKLATGLYAARELRI